MHKLLAIAMLLVLSACTSTPIVRDPSPCDAGEATYDCQVERYNNVNVD